MTRVLAVAVLAFVILGGRTAWAEDPAAPDAGALPAPPAGAVTSPTTPPDSAPATAPADSVSPAPPCPPVPPEAAVTVGAEGPAAEGSPEAVALSMDQALRALDPAATERRVNPWSGSARLRYRLRTTGDESDNDIYAYLRAKYRDESQPGLSGSFHGRLSLDLGSFGNQPGQFNVFSSIDDTYDHRLNGRIYHLYLNHRWACGPVQEVRLGRQYADVGEYITFDGVRVQSARFTSAHLAFGGFLGVPAHLFEDGPQGDVLAGAQVLAQPLPGTELELDYTYEKDDNVYGILENHLFNFVWNQRLGQGGFARLNYQQLEDQPRLLHITFDKAWLCPDLAVRGYFHSLLNDQAEAVYDFDYYYWNALSLRRYWEAYVNVSKGLGPHMDVEGGFAIRRLYHSSDQGRYNREYERYYLGASTYDWLCQGLSLTVTGEWWNSDDDVWTATCDAEYRPSRRWRFAVGTDYAAYRYDLYADSERQNVYGAFFRVGWRPSRRWSFDARVRVEDDDYDTYTTFDATAAFNF